MGEVFQWDLLFYQRVFGKWCFCLLEGSAKVIPSQSPPREEERRTADKWVAALGGRDKFLVPYPGLIGGNRINLPRTMGG